jgi:hypothetical protein
LNAPVNASSETDHAFAQTITWGLAGAGAVMLTTIVTAHLRGPAIWIATACFSLSVPVLIALGVVYRFQTDPKIAPPTLKSMLGLTLLLIIA